MIIIYYYINTISNTTGTFQNNRYSDIFTLSHEPPLVFFDSLNSSILRFEAKKKKGTKKV